MNYPVGDFLIRLKNASLAGKKEIVAPYSKEIEAIGRILLEEKFIKDFTIRDSLEKKLSKTGKQKEKKTKSGKEVIVSLWGREKKAIHDIEIVSKPSLHIYINKKNIPRTRGGFGISILSTSRGIMTDKKARKEGIGGEVICKIY
jgi:small subunit ribosomal protein S8